MGSGTAQQTNGSWVGGVEPWFDLGDQDIGMTLGFDKMRLSVDDDWYLAFWF